MGKTLGKGTECYYCGTEERCTKDHFVPKRAGGKVMVWACLICQRSKGGMMPLEWLEYIKRHAAILPAIKKKIEGAVVALWARLDETKKELKPVMHKKDKQRPVKLSRKMVRASLIKDKTQ